MQFYRNDKTLCVYSGWVLVTALVTLFYIICAAIAIWAHLHYTGRCGGSDGFGRITIATMIYITIRYGLSCGIGLVPLVTMRHIIKGPLMHRIAYTNQLQVRLGKYNGKYVQGGKDLTRRAVIRESIESSMQSTKSTTALERDAMRDSVKIMKAVAQRNDKLCTDVDSPKPLDGVSFLHSSTFRYLPALPDTVTLFMALFWLVVGLDQMLFRGSPTAINQPSGTHDNGSFAISYNNTDSLAVHETRSLDTCLWIPGLYWFMMTCAILMGSSRLVIMIVREKLAGSNSLSPTGVKMLGDA